MKFSKKLFFVSLIFLMLTIFDTNIINVFFLLCFLLFVILFYPKIENTGKLILFDNKILLISCFVCYVFISNFYNNYILSSKLRIVSDYIDISSTTILIVICVLFFIFSLYCIYFMIAFIGSLNFEKNKEISKFGVYIYKNINRFTFILICIFVLFFLLFSPGGADLSFHLERLNAIICELQNNGIFSFPIRLYRHAINGLGYASPLFYCDIFMWPFAIVSKITGLSVVNTYKLMVSTYIFVAYYISRYSFSLVFKKCESDLCTFFYTTSVMMFSLFTGGWVGRFFASLFIPLASCSFYCIINKSNNNRNIILLSLGMTGILFGNILDALIICFSFIIIILFYFKKISTLVIKNIFISALLCVFLSSWFIFPMIEQILFQELVLSSNNFNKIYDLYWYTMPFVGLFLPGNLMLLLYETLKLTPQSASGYYIYGMLLFLMVLFYCFVYRKDMFTSTITKALFFLLIIFVIFQTRLFPHRLMANITGILQFPIRTNIVMTFISSTLIVQLYKKSKNSKMLYMLIGMSIFFTIIYGMFQCNRNIDYSFSTYDVGCGEYLPSELLKGNTIEDVSNIDSILLNRGINVICDDYHTEFTMNKDFNSTIVDYSNATDTTIFDFPLIYYKGYTIKNNGQTIDYSKSNTGTIEVKPIYSEGTITATYDGTFIQRVSIWISIVSLVLLIIYCIYTKILNKKNNV